MGLLIRLSTQRSENSTLDALVSLCHRLQLDTTSPQALPSLALPGNPIMSRSSNSMADQADTQLQVEIVPSIDDINALIRPPSASVTAATFTHTPCYCEENVYLLCKKLSSIGIAEPSGLDLFVIFISNELKKIPLWYQKASNIEEGLVVWDYHVICIQVKPKETNGGAVDIVWDLDSTLPFPLALGQYIRKAIRPLSFENSMYRRLFRIVHAPRFLEYFASDRSHMKDASGNWTSPPPTYDPIVAEDGTTHNLNEYMKLHSPDESSMKDLVDRLYTSKYGVVVSEALLEEFFSQIHV